VDEVDAGSDAGVARAECDAGEFNALAPEGGDAEGGADLAGTEDGLGAEGGILLDDEVFQGDAGHREQGEGDAIEVDGAAKRCADVGGDAALETADADERRDEDEQQQDQEDGEDEGEPAANAMGIGGLRLGAWVDVVVGGGGVHRRAGSELRGRTILAESLLIEEGREPR